MPPVVRSLNFCVGALVDELQASDLARFLDQGGATSQEPIQIRLGRSTRGTGTKESGDLIVDLDHVVRSSRRTWRNVVNAAIDPRPDRTDRAVERLGDLSGAQIGVVPQHHCCALIERQPVEQVVQRCLNGDLHSTGRLDQTRCVPALDRRSSSRITAPVQHGTIQVRTRFGQIIPAAKHFHHGVMHHIVGGLVRMQKHIRTPHLRSVLTSIKAAEGCRPNRRRVVRHSTNLHDSSTHSKPRRIQPTQPGARSRRASGRTPGRQQHCIRNRSRRTVDRRGRESSTAPCQRAPTRRDEPTMRRPQHPKPQWLSARRSAWPSNRSRRGLVVPDRHRPTATEAVRSGAGPSWAGACRNAVRKTGDVVGESSRSRTGASATG